MALPCINLQDLYGRRCRIAFEPGHGPLCRAPWLMVIPCKYGHIGPWGTDTLCASVEGHARVALKLKALPCVEIVQDGDFGEMTVEFRPEDFRQVAKIMRPRSRRRLSEAHRQKLLEAGAGFRFARGSNGPSAAPGREFSDQDDA